MTRISIKPGRGRRVRDPATGLVVPAKGATVDLTIYWQRRLDDGDVVPKTGKPT